MTAIGNGQPYGQAQREEEIAAAEFKAAVQAAGGIHVDDLEELRLRKQAEARGEEPTRGGVEVLPPRRERRADPDDELDVPLRRSAGERIGSAPSTRDDAPRRTSPRDLPPEDDEGDEIDWDAPVIRVRRERQPKPIEFELDDGSIARITVPVIGNQKVGKIGWYQKRVRDIVQRLLNTRDETAADRLNDALVAEQEAMMMYLIPDWQEGLMARIGPHGWWVLNQVIKRMSPRGDRDTARDQDQDDPDEVDEYLMGRRSGRPRERQGGRRR